MKDHHIGLKYFRPMFVEPVNTQELKGLYTTVMRLYSTLEPQYAHGHYLPVKFDVSIYRSFLRVFLSFFFQI